jgi:adenine-specific DNA-methyltransferase
MRIIHSDSHKFVRSLRDESVDLLCFDPPYYGVVDDGWDNQWLSPGHYVEWMHELLLLMFRKSSPFGSLVFFQGIGKDLQHPIFGVVHEAERIGWHFRDWITWKKRRAYGCGDRYLYCREEILWFSRDKKRWAFNVPLTSQRRGYSGWNSKYPAKSEYKRVSNVWDDIPEIMRPERTAQKPVPLLERLIATHSMPGAFVVDPFVGWGTTAVACVKLDRQFEGCDADKCEVARARGRVERIRKQVQAG